EVFQRQVPQLYEALSRQPEGPLRRDFLPALYAGDPRFGLPSLDALRAVSMEDVREWLEPHLRSAPLTVCVVGDFEVDAAIEAGARTFGVLPPRRPLEPYAA